MQLNVAVKPDALQDIGGQVLVWVMTEPAFEAAEVEVGAWRGVGIAGRDAALRPTVPHSVTSQLRGFGLTSGNDPAATTVDVRWGDPRLLLVSGGREVVERVPESPLGLSPSSSDGMMSRMARQAGAVIEGGRVLEQFARYRGGVQRLHLSAQSSKRVSPPRRSRAERRWEPRPSRTCAGGRPTQEQCVRQPADGPRFARRRRRSRTGRRRGRRL